MYQSSTDPSLQDFSLGGYTPGGVAINEEDEPFDWNVLVPTIHPTKILVMEAIAYIAQPLSSTDLMKVFGNELDLSNISHHVRRLAKAMVLRPVSQRRVRGSIETYYYFADF